jgi:UDPglucose 6-dehydrogenase
MLKCIVFKLCIIGDGFVGRSVYKAFSRNFACSILGPQQEPLKEKFDFCFICVPTNTIDGSTDLSNVHDSLKKIDSDVYILKSTVPVGTGRELSKEYNVVYCPEFLSESKYFNPTNFDGDLIKWPFFVMAGEDKNTNKVYNLFLSVFGPCKKYSFVNFETAELLKYSINSYFATKVAFFNNIFDICKQYNVDYKLLRENILLDERISALHTAVFEENRGFGGKCLPKDLESFLNQIKDSKNKSLLNCVKQYNSAHFESN